MDVAIVLNLFQGSLANPVDEHYIGPECRLPIIKHRLQRLFNRKLIDTIVQFDIYRLLDTKIDAQGTSVHQVLHATKIRELWDEGFIAPAQRDTPMILRQRVLPTNQRRLKHLVHRFGKSMSGQVLTTLPSRPYSYLQKLTMDIYAYSYKFANRLLGYIRTPSWQTRTGLTQLYALLDAKIVISRVDYTQ